MMTIFLIGLAIGFCLTASVTFGGAGLAAAERRNPKLRDKAVRRLHMIGSVMQAIALVLVWFAAS